MIRREPPKSRKVVHESAVMVRGSSTQHFVLLAVSVHAPRRSDHVGTRSGARQYGFRRADERLRRHHYGHHRPQASGRAGAAAPGRAGVRVTPAHDGGNGRHVGARDQSAASCDCELRTRKRASAPARNGFYKAAEFLDAPDASRDGGTVAPDFRDPDIRCAAVGAPIRVVAAEVDSEPPRSFRHLISNSSTRKSLLNLPSRPTTPRR